ncbi:hypothetical protein CO661_14250 [Sinorhizobium fredii]|uniref:Methyltransferase FkbM domain-containing protein n=1 Tax=Rhizobium fredii TaxID=380 RepID=A0A2A6LYG7_RHIFR|nr:FkbM family methyltransferase [Sinorhizobium fredii]PDT47340.1 hypothetical protein CO661_14250 [Sinorhizobium fredii]
MQDALKTIFGSFAPESKKRLDLTFDYETCAIRSFRDIAAHIGATQIVDIGANIGVYSIFTADLPRVQKVHAFEPAPDSLALLKKNISLQPSASKVKAYDVALSDHAGEVKFNIISPMSGANGIAEDDKPGNFITVRAKSLDEMLTFSGETVAVKIDVEGHEPATLAGAVRFLRSNKCFVQVESLRHATVEAVRRIMADVGYIHLFSLQNDHLFIDPDLRGSEKSLLDIISKNLAADLHDLTELRLEKRRLAAEAKRLWQSAGYREDPVFKK